MALINTALNTEIVKGDFHAVKQLIETKGYSPNYTGFLGLSHTPLYTAAASKQVEILNYLIQKGADVNVQTKSEKSSVLMFACDDNNLEIVKMLLEAGANPNLKDEDGETALQKTDSEEIKQLLKQYGAKE